MQQRPLTYLHCIHAGFKNKIPAVKNITSSINYMHTKTVKTNNECFYPRGASDADARVLAAIV